MVTLLANNELVAISWIGSIPGLSTQMVATQLPDDQTKWAASGFIVVSTIGGIIDPYLPVNLPVMQVDCYAVTPGSNKAPWFKANNLAMIIQRACWDRFHFNRLLTLKAGNASYPAATVTSAYLTTPPRRIYDDPGDYARYQTDLALTWITSGDQFP
jgi:hypothetical protein